MKHLHTFESFLNEAKVTWFPSSISILKDIYIGDKSLWTSTGKNTDDFIIPKGTVITLKQDGASNKNKDATYNVTLMPTEGEPKYNVYAEGETDVMYFGLKDIVNLIKQEAVSLPPGMYGHDITLYSMLK